MVRGSVCAEDDPRVASGGGGVGAGSGVTQLRVYFQNGAQESGVSELVWSGKWVQGAAVIPPAAQ